MSVCQAVEAALAVAAVESMQRKPEPLRHLSFFGKYDLWMYDAVLDNRLCNVCLGHEKHPRYFGSQLRVLFPHLMILDENIIGGPEPNGNGLAHPNCRCRLHRVVDWSLDDIKWFIAYAGVD